MIYFIKWFIIYIFRFQLFIIRGFLKTETENRNKKKNNYNFWEVNKLIFLNEWYDY